ncbi:MAG: glutamate-5-semialdehyde dehydrogenase [Deltaproteobacteria bacterium]|nr:glutamate-5-semialdehyde dehydrogenase [Deltaproteobacteria bacterium]
MRDLLLAARAAVPRMAQATTAQKHRFLEKTAELIAQRCDSLAAINQLDLAEAERVGRPRAMIDRLRLDAPRLRALAQAVTEVLSLADPVGAITHGEIRPTGLEVRRQRIPLGIIGIIYEARPNVTVDAAVLALKAGNCVVLRGGSEAKHSNAALVDLLREALADSGLPGDAVQTPAYLDHQLVDLLVSTVPGLDVVIPRGGTALIDAVMRSARVPVIQHYQGVCHLFVEASADLAMAENLAVNAKTQRPGVCNAMECLLIDAAIADAAVPKLVGALHARGVEVRGCPQTVARSGGLAVAATDGDFGFEFLDLICAVKVVGGLQGALDHITRYGSHHTEAIVTRDLDAARAFVGGIDASCVLVNASTRFNDGGCLGLGAEIGISTTKLHAYGPMGLEALTAERFVVYGQGQVRT